MQQQTLAIAIFNPIRKSKFDYTAFEPLYVTSEIPLTIPSGMQRTLLSLNHSLVTQLVPK